MRPVPAHPASTAAPGHNPGPTGRSAAAEAPLVTDLSLEDLERDARHAIGEMAYAYYSGGADDERLLEGNVAAWSHWQLHPHVLAGLAEVSTETTLLGTAVARRWPWRRRRFRGWPTPRARWRRPGAPPRRGRC